MVKCVLCGCAVHVDDLRGHLAKAHLQYRPYFCEFCNQAFASDSEMIMHVRAGRRHPPISQAPRLIPDLEKTLSALFAQSVAAGERKPKATSPRGRKDLKIAAKSASERKRSPQPSQSQVWQRKRRRISSSDEDFNDEGLSDSEDGERRSEAVGGARRSARRRKPVSRIDDDDDVGSNPRRPRRHRSRSISVGSTPTPTASVQPEQSMRCQLCHAAGTHRQRNFQSARSKRRHVIGHLEESVPAFWTDLADRPPEAGEHYPRVYLSCFPDRPHTSSSGETGGTVVAEHPDEGDDSFTPPDLRLSEERAERETEQLAVLTFGPKPEPPKPSTAARPPPTPPPVRSSAVRCCVCDARQLHRARGFQLLSAIQSHVVHHLKDDNQQVINEMSRSKKTKKGQPLGPTLEKLFKDCFPTSPAPDCLTMPMVAALHRFADRIVSVSSMSNPEPIAHPASSSQPGVGASVPAEGDTDTSAVSVQTPEVSPARSAKLMLKRRKEQRERCALCDELFTDQQCFGHVLMTHFDKHTAQCSYCLVTSRTVPQLLDHMAWVHSGQAPAVIDLKKTYWAEIVDAVERCFPGRGQSLQPPDDSDQVAQPAATTACAESEIDASETITTSPEVDFVTRDSIEESVEVVAEPDRTLKPIADRPIRRRRRVRRPASLRQSISAAGGVHVAADEPTETAQSCASDAGEGRKSTDDHPQPKASSPNESPCQVCFEVVPPLELMEHVLLHLRRRGIWRYRCGHLGCDARAAAVDEMMAHCDGSGKHAKSVVLDDLLTSRFQSLFANDLALCFPGAKCCYACAGRPVLRPIEHVYVHLVIVHKTYRFQCTAPGCKEGFALERLGLKHAKKHGGDVCLRDTAQHPNVDRLFRAEYFNCFDVALLAASSKSKLPSLSAFVTSGSNEGAEERVQPSKGGAEQKTCALCDRPVSFVFLLEHVYIQHLFASGVKRYECGECGAQGNTMIEARTRCRPNHAYDSRPAKLLDHMAPSPPMRHMPAQKKLRELCELAFGLDADAIRRQLKAPVRQPPPIVAAAAAATEQAVEEETPTTVGDDGEWADCAVCAARVPADTSRQHVYLHLHARRYSRFACEECDAASFSRELATAACVSRHADRPSRVVDRTAQLQTPFAHTWAECFPCVDLAEPTDTVVSELLEELTNQVTDDEGSSDSFAEMPNLCKQQN